MIVSMISHERTRQKITDKNIGLLNTIRIHHSSIFFYILSTRIIIKIEAS